MSARSRYVPVRRLSCVATPILILAADNLNKIKRTNDGLASVVVVIVVLVVFIVACAMLSCCPTVLLAVWLGMFWVAASRIFTTN